MKLFLLCAATLKVKQTVDLVRKLCLNPSSYVTAEWPGRALIGPFDTKQARERLRAADKTSRVCCCSGESAAAAFRGLKKLSRVFKDQLAYPLIASAREGKDSPDGSDGSTGGVSGSQYSITS